MHVLLLKLCVCVCVCVCDFGWVTDRLQCVKSLQCDKSTILCFIASVTYKYKNSFYVSIVLSRLSLLGASLSLFLSLFLSLTHTLTHVQLQCLCLLTVTVILGGRLAGTER